MEQETVVRKIEEKDIPAVSDLVGGTINDPSYRKKYTGIMNERMRYYLEHKEKSAQYIALDGEKIVGFALAGTIGEEDLDKYYFVDHRNPREPLSWVFLGQITVDAEYRHKGIGSMLLDRVEERAREMNMKGVYTGTRGNTRLFYEKNDFVIDKVFLKKPLRKEP